MSGTKKRNKTMYATLLKQLLSLLLIAILLYQALLMATQIIPKIQNNSYYMLQSITKSKAKQLSERLRLIMDASDEFALQMEQDIIAMETEKDHDYRLDRIYERAVIHITGLLSRNMLITGAFVYLDDVYSNDDKEQFMSGMHIRDNVPDNYSSNYSDLILHRGSIPIVQKFTTTLPPSQFWTEKHNRQNEQTFITKPMLTADNAALGKSRKNMGYWSDVFRYTRNEPEVITYSEPLFGGDGKVVGVAGIEISTNNLLSFMEHIDIPFESSLFVLSKLDKDIEFDGSSEGGVAIDMHPNSVVISGLQSSAFFSNQPGYVRFTPLKDNLAGYSLFTAHSYAFDDDLVAIPYKLDLYGANSPFSNEDFALFGVAAKSRIGAVAQTTMKLNYSIIGFTFLSLIVGLWWISYKVSNIIKKLSDEVKMADSHINAVFEPTYIEEIENLTFAFTNMNRKIMKIETKMSNVINLVGLNFGVFEEDRINKTVFLTDSLYRILGIDKNTKITPENLQVHCPEFANIRSAIFDDPESNTLGNSEMFLNNQWYGVHYQKSEESICATIIDITDKILARKKLEFERDYDPLTNLFNRSSYHDLIQKKIQQQPELVGALLFCDLDSLKFINDNFGHNAGDTYIKTAASALSNAFDAYDSVVARIAGDEFVVYIHGFVSVEEAVDMIQNALVKVKSTNVVIPDKHESKVSLSAGVSFYPSDSADLLELVKYSDFAMLEIKRSSKGGLRVFNRITYDRDIYKFNKVDYLETFLDKKLMRFAFQPILDVANKCLFGYEALIRPKMREISSPEFLLSLAKSDSKLYQTEKVILDCIFRWMQDSLEQIGSNHIFINTVSEVILTSEHWLELENSFPDIFNRIVLEISQKGFTDIAELDVKINRFRQKGTQIAICDYSDDKEQLGLLQIKPEIIKISMHIVRDIDKDPSKQYLYESIASFARKHSIKVLALGIETESELRTVLKIGADYIQGFLIGMPDFDLFEPSSEIMSIITEYKEE